MQLVLEAGRAGWSISNSYRIYEMKTCPESSGSVEGLEIELVGRTGEGSLGG